MHFGLSKSLSDGVRPGTTVIVAGLLAPQLLLEVEATAVLAHVEPLASHPGDHVE
jgi:hypothetical protein